MENEPKFHLNLHNFLVICLNSIKITLMDSSHQNVPINIWLYIV